MLLMGTSTISTGPWLQVRKLFVITRGYSQCPVAFFGTNEPPVDRYRQWSHHLKKRGGLRREMREMNWWGINKDKNYGDDFPFSWEFHHPNPNWRTHIFQRGWFNHQPGLMGIDDLARFQSFFSRTTCWVNEHPWEVVRQESRGIPCDNWTLGYGK